MRSRLLAAMLSVCIVLLTHGSVIAGAVLDRVKSGGILRCGITSSGIGLSAITESGQWEGMFAEMCRVVAAAVTGQAGNVDYVELSTTNRFDGVRSGQADVLMSGTTWTLEREAMLGLTFPVIYLFDGQGFMARKSMGAKRLADVSEASVCVIEDTTSIRNLDNYLRTSRQKFTLRRFSTLEGGMDAFFNHHCDLFTVDRIALFALRRLQAPNPDDYIIFPEVISKEPLGPVVQAGDPDWQRVVFWAVGALVLAEEKGVTAANAAALKAGSPDAEIQYLLGARPGIGRWLGLDDEWALRVITQVGNYGEIFERHLGKSSRLRIDRGINALWKDGGLLYVPPLGG